jgi:hypothetical protein
MQIVEIVTAFAYLICSYWIWGDGIGFMRLNRTGGQHAEQIPYRRHHRRNMTIQGRGGRFFFSDTPRCGRSQERGKEQQPSILLIWTSQKPFPLSSRAYSPLVWR